MKFSLFFQTIIIPTTLVVSGFLVTQYFTSFVSQAEFAEHKIKDERNISTIVTKLDMLIESHKELKAELRRVRR